MLVNELLATVKNPIKDCILQEHIDKLTTAGPFALWGRGDAASYALQVCRRLGLEPVCVCDSFTHLPGETFEGVPLWSADELDKSFPDCLVLICCLFIYGIDAELEKRGHPYLIWDTTLIQLFQSAQSPAERLKAGAEEIEAVYTSLADSLSKKTYQNVLRYRLTGDRQLLSEVLEPNIYFDNDVVPQVDGGAFVDCGAYTGDTLKAFHESANCKCSVYYALEPDENNLSRLEAYVRSVGLENVKILPVGCWNETGTVYFSGNRGGSSNIVTSDIPPDAQSQVKVDTLDRILGGERAGFIKMDIEGAEIQALCGAKRILREQTPVLAISIYHKLSDFWEIPRLVRELGRDYRLYVRHHTAFSCDTVLYAIPSNRKA